jgi:hypothetical protein
MLRFNINRSIRYKPHETRGFNFLIFNKKLVRFNTEYSKAILDSAKQGRRVSVLEGSLLHTDIVSVQKSIYDRQDDIKLELIKISSKQKYDFCSSSQLFVGTLGGAVTMIMIMNRDFGFAIFMGFLSGLAIRNGLSYLRKRGLDMENKINLTIENEILNQQIKKLEQLKK